MNIESLLNLMHKISIKFLLTISKELRIYIKKVKPSYVGVHNNFNLLFKYLLLTLLIGAIQGYGL